MLKYKLKQIRCLRTTSAIHRDFRNLKRLQNFAWWTYEFGLVRNNGETDSSQFMQEIMETIEIE